MFAVIKTGGKQYLVSPGHKLKIEKLSTPEGERLVFDEVLLHADDKKTEIGMPLIKGATVEARVLRQGRNRKVIIFRYKNKTRRRTKKGHRQHFTEVEIGQITEK
ncbi:MAG: 50S ribosomal protein L21 [Candidatus Sungbacteria bacterium]|nr:50S ribosomal protein L21 [Candidatus Sungbacteria bacterium]